MVIAASSGAVSRVGAAFLRAGLTFGAAFTLVAFAALVLSPSAGAAEFPVTKTTDSADGTCDADCSLREAVIAANANGEADRITLPPGTYTLTLAGADEDLAATGDLDFTAGDVEIRGTGAGPGSVRIDASALGDRIIDAIGGDLRVLNLILRGGSVSGTADDDGGAIRNVRELTLRDLVFDQNHADLHGGAIHSSATTSRVTIEDSIFSGNTATHGGAIRNEDESTVVVARSLFTGNVVGSRGGAVYNQEDGAFTATDTGFTGNEAGSDGGAIFHQNTSSLALVRAVVSGNEATEAGGAMFIQNDSATMIHETTIAGNKAFGTGSSDGGGAMYLNNDSAVLIERSTISGNTSAGDAGGISRNNDGQLLMHNSTVSGNSAGGNGGGLIFDSLDGSAFIAVESSTIAGNSATGLGGGIYNEGDPDLEAGLERTIIAANTASGAANDCATDGTGDFDSRGNNLDSTGTCGLGAAGDIANGNAALGPLADNGGPTATRALLDGSDAIDAAGTGCPPPAADQRGTARPQGDGCDIGAFERVPPPPDTTPPVLSLDGKKKRKVRKAVKVKVTVGCDEACTVEGGGKVVVKVKKKGKKGSRRKTYKLKPASRSLSAGAEKNLKLKVRGKKKARKAKRAIKRAGKGKAKIAVTARDDAGNESGERLTVKLKA